MAPSCQSCRHCILQCQPQLTPSIQSGYINMYHHATCYTNRKDFTKLYGFYSLRKEDQKVNTVTWAPLAPKLCNGNRAHLAPS